MSTERIVADEGAKLDFSRDMSYGDYLHLDTVLAAQHPLSPAHDELLFIVQHQTSELWMKLMLHELCAAVACIARDELGSAFKMLARVSRIMEQLVHAWDVLATMTPPEYSAIRPYLSNSSGFQSWQYRCIEFMLGNKNAAMLKPAPSCWHGSTRPGARRRCTTNRCACSRGAACRFRQTTSSATGRSRTPRATPSSRLGSRSTANRRRTGSCTSSARS
jgi:tryptophan 2,3-dioxygenase